MISHRHRCIYVKVPKCASTTVLEWFVAHGGGRHSFRPYWYGGLLSERIQGLTRTLNRYPDYAAFSFVRNPYERFVSLYRYLRGLASNNPGRRASSPARGQDVPRSRRVFRAHPPDYGSLGEFAELCGEVLEDFGPLWGEDARAFFRAHGGRTYGPKGIQLRHLGFVTGHARPQTDFLLDCNPRRLFGVARGEEAPFSFIGAVENMAADWRRLSDTLGLPAAALPGGNAAGPGAGGAHPTRYAGYYDRATRRLVEDIYAADLDFTGCGFYDGRRSAALAARPVAPAPRAVRRRRTGLRLARGWHRLCSLEVAVEARILRSTALRRLLRPLGRLRRFLVAGPAP